MTPWEVPLVVLAGIGGGLSGSIAGLASLVSYPALLAVGLPPVTANVTNTVALVASSTGSILGSRPELRGQAARVRRLGATAVAGGIVGGLLLLSTPSGLFEGIVPWLIAFGSLTILLSKRPAPHPDGAPYTTDSRLVVGLVFVIGIYAGYFGAAAGVLLLALFLAATPETLPRCNGLKNVVLGLANVVAAVVFAVFGSVDWLVALPLAVGLFIGARVGPIVVRRAPDRPLRVAIALAGVGLAIYLAVDAYS
jgi:uncharacterized membrane protein YfcA